MGKKIRLASFPFLLVAYEIVNYLSNDLYLPALPSIAHELKITDNLAQLTFTIWLMGGVSVQLFLGPLSDRYGRRPVLLIGGIVFLFSTSLCAFAPNISILLIGRYLQGAAVPSMMIAGYAAINESLSSKQAIKILVQMQSITTLAPATGPFLGSLMLEIVNWRWLFGLLVMAACTMLAMLYFKMPETLASEKKQSIQLSLVLKQYLLILKNFSFIKHLLAANLVIGALTVWMVAGPFLVVNEFHHSTVYFGIFQAVIFGSFTLGAYSVNHLLKNVEIETLVLNALSCSLVGGILSIVFAFLFSNALLYQIVSLMIVAFGAGIAFPTLKRMAIEESRQPMGARMSILSLFQFATAALVSLVVSYLPETLIYLGVMVFICSLLAFGIFFMPIPEKSE